MVTIYELCALQVSSALQNLICSALLLSAALQSHAHNSEARYVIVWGKKCLLRSRTCVQGKSLDVNDVSSLIIDEVFEV